MSEFAMDYKLSIRDRKILQPIVDVVDEILILNQDYWSWDKEYYAWNTQGNRLFNCIDFFCQMESLSIAKARDKVKGMILDGEREFVKCKMEFCARHPEDSRRLRRWIEALGATIGSYNYIASVHPRYHTSLETPSWVLTESSNTGELSEPVASGQLGSDSPDLLEQRHPGRSGVVEDDVSCNKDADAISSPRPGAQMLDDSAIAAPRNYINSLPSKGVRSALIEVFNLWLPVPPSSLSIIDELIRTLHGASLILDDIQDNSNLRRGKPATHVIFGYPQAINSATSMFIQALQWSRKLGSPAASDIVLQHLDYLHLGQSWDLYWKHNLQCPSQDEYIQMVDQKTGAMFRLLVNLLQAESSVVTGFCFDKLLLLLGRFFQIRDDYMNLPSTEYGDQKGFCEDLEEGKYSYLIVHLMHHEPASKVFVTGIFRRLVVGSDRGTNSTLFYECKLQILHLLKEAKTFEATLGYLKRMETQIDDEIAKLEHASGKTNPLLRLVTARLSVKHLVI